MIDAIIDHPAFFFTVVFIVLALPPTLLLLMLWLASYLMKYRYVYRCKSRYTVGRVGNGGV